MLWIYTGTLMKGYGYGQYDQEGIGNGVFFVVRGTQTELHRFIVICIARQRPFASSQESDLMIMRGSIRFTEMHSKGQWHFEILCI